MDNERFWYSNLFTKQEMRNLSDYDLATFIMYEHLFLNQYTILTNEDLEDITQDIYLVILKNKKNNKQRDSGLRLDSIVHWTHRIFQKYLKHYESLKPKQKYVDRINQMINFKEGRKINGK